MKLIGKILIPILVIVAIPVAAVGVGYAMLSSSKTISYTYDEENAKDLETLTAEDLASSLANIKNTNYSDNKLTIDFTLDELNGFLTQALRTSINENYLKTDTDYLINEDGFIVKKVAFVESENGLTLAATVDAFSAIKSYGSVTVTASMKENNNLELDLGSVKVGTITIKSSDLTSFMQNIQTDTTEPIDGITLDAQNLSVTIDMNALIRNYITEPVLLHLLDCLDYSLSLEDNKATLTVDTTPLFKGKYTRPEITDADLDSKIAVAAGLSYLSEEASFTVTESEFNYLIQDDMEESIASFASSLSFGGQEFAYSISDPYLKVSNTTLEGDFSINGVETNLNLGVTINKAMDEDGYLDKVSFIVDSAGLGEVAFDDFNGFEVSFDSVQETFTKNNPLVKVKDITFTEDSSDVTVTVVKAF